MKDAAGHGSDAHQSGVMAATAPKEYSWGKVRQGIHALMANGNLADQLGTVMRNTMSNGKKVWVANYPQIGSNPAGWSHHGSVQGAKRLVESKLANSWEPPRIK